MNKYETIKDLPDDKFKRLTDIYRNTLNKMIELLKEQCRKDRIKGGRNRKLVIEDLLLMALEYLREYRTILSYITKLRS